MAITAAQQRRAHRAVRATIGLVFLSALAYLLHGWGIVYLWTREDLPRTAEGFLDTMHPGYWRTAEWIRSQGYTRLHTMPYESDNKRQQRLLEMLYPIELVPTEPAALRPGDVAVVGINVMLPQPVDELFRYGALAVVKVRE